MQDWDDIALLREYVERGTEEAFALLVTRHINRVYSIALRHTKNPHQAEEITQTVFVILARKAASLGKKVILEGWLYNTARLTAVTAIRSDLRRSRREKESQMQNLSNETDPDVWQQIEPFLDNAMESLNETDRHAVVLRYFYGKSMREVGVALGGSEGAATLRLHRALEKLRRFFLKRGVTSTTAAIGAAMIANSAHAAPPALAKSVTTAAVAKGVAAGGSASALTNAVLKMLAWAKIKFALGTAAILLVAAGGTELYALRKNSGSSAMASRSHFPKSEWTNAGFASPEAAAVTYFWAQSAGDLEAFSETGTKNFSDFMTNMVLLNKSGTPAQVLAGRVKDFTGITLERSRELSDGRVCLNLIFDNVPETEGWVTLIMTNVEGNWKIATQRQFFGSTLKEYPMPAVLADADFAPRAGSDLQGYWKGAIHTPRGDSGITVKIAEPIQDLFRADFFNVEQASLRPALITRDGATVTMRLMWAYGTFHGTLSSDGKKIEGTWLQGSRKLPATLTRTEWVKP